MLQFWLTRTYGDSTTGKTTAGELAISTAGLPSLKENTLMSNWHATSNGIKSMIGGNHGCPFFFDEFSMASGSDHAKTIYTLEAGKEKGRLTKDLQLREAVTWLLTIISTGEVSMLANASHNTGSKIRVIEIGNVTFTRDAENAEAIKSGVKRHYGHAAPELAKYMLKMGEYHVLGIWEKWRVRIVDETINPDKFTIRTATKLAVIMATAQIANESMDLQFDLEALLQFLLENDNRNSGNRDIAESAYDYFLEQISMNEHKFDGTGNEKANIEKWGKISTFKKRTEGSFEYATEVTIIKSKYEELMKAGQFNDTSVILSKWSEKSILDHEKDRLTRRRSITTGGTKATVYVIRVRYELENETHKKRMESSPKRKVKTALPR